MVVLGSTIVSLYEVKGYRLSIAQLLMETHMKATKCHWKGRPRNDLYCLAPYSLSHGVTPATWDYTVLPATWHRWTRPALT